DSTICQDQLFLTRLHRYGREQPGDGRARADDVAHAHARIRSSREVAWSTGLQLVTHDTQSADAVMQPVERCALKLRETRGNQSARSPETRASRCARRTFRLWASRWRPRNFLASLISSSSVSPTAA